jgi:hypothetical protein
MGHEGVHMADIATIVVAGIGAVATVTSGLGGSLGGYLLAGRNDEARDIRAEQREERSRAAALAERLQEQRHDWQREVLLELQDELQRLARATGRILHQDLMTVRETGRVTQLPEGLGGDDSLAATVAVQKLRERVLAADLRALVGDFVGYCAFATTGYLADHKDDPPDELEAFIRNRETEMGFRYAGLMQQLGEHLRREVDRP